MDAKEDQNPAERCRIWFVFEYHWCFTLCKSDLQMEQRAEANDAHILVLLDAAIFPVPSNSPMVSGCSVLCFPSLVPVNSFCHYPTQLNHSLRPPPPVTACREAFRRAPRPPLGMTTAKTQRQLTWQRQPSSTCPHAVGRDPRASALSPGSPAPRWAR